MQSTNQFKKPQSRCSYCGSVNRGKGCRYAPHGVHVHLEDPLRCSYCGSSSYGRGCKLNPISDLHVRGAFYNSMIKEMTQNYLDNEVLLNFLTKQFEEFECYKQGIIDKNGNKIKEPLTESEQISFSPFIRTILKVKKMLGSKIDLIDASALLESNSIPFQTMDKYKQLLEFKEKINDNINNLHAILGEAMSSGLTIEELKTLIKA